MKETLNREALERLEEIFGDRLKSEENGTTAIPLNVGEVQLLSEVAQRYSMPLVPIGAGTSPEADEYGGLLIRFDLMRHTRLPEGDESWIEAEAGTVWLKLENELRAGGLGLAVYPTSAPRATVGGWLTTDGLGVGSFEYGWSSENVLSANVVLPGGELRKVRGTDLQSFVHTTADTAIIVSAKLKTRVANTDIPFAVAYKDPNALLGAVTATVEAGMPLWHLAFLNPAMARTRALEDDYLLFGAYPRERSDEVEEGIRHMAEGYEGTVLPIVEAHRIWTERFFPVAPAHPTPNANRAFVHLSQLPALLSDDQIAGNTALQGTVSRSKEALLLTYDPGA